MDDSRDPGPSPCGEGDSRITCSPFGTAQQQQGYQRGPDDEADQCRAAHHHPPTPAVAFGTVPSLHEANMRVT